MTLTKYEMETIVNYNADEATASIYTAYPRDIRRLDKLVNEFPDIYKCIERTDISCTYEMPKSYISYRKPRQISEEQRERARERMIRNTH